MSECDNCGHDGRVWHQLNGPDVTDLINESADPDAIVCTFRGCQCVRLKTSPRPFGAPRVVDILSFSREVVE